MSLSQLITIGPASAAVPKAVNMMEYTDGPASYKVTQSKLKFVACSDL